VAKRNFMHKLLRLHCALQNTAESNGGFDMQHRFIRLHELTAVTGMSRSTIYNRMKDGSFPRSYQLGARLVAWLEKDVESWMASKVEGSKWNEVKDWGRE
jgi:prophage regulatory protein